MDSENEISTPLKHFVNTIYYSSKCRVIYIILAVYNIILAIWIIVDLVKSEKPTLIFYILESLINLVLLCDVILRVWVKTCYHYWRSFTNIIEFCLVLICTLSTVISIIRNLFLFHRV